MSGTSKPTINEYLSYLLYTCGLKLLEGFTENEKEGFLAATYLILDTVFIDKDKHLIFNTLVTKVDPFFIKQLSKILKTEYRAFVKDYAKTADPTRLSDPIVKSIIYNTIIKVLLFAYAGNINNIIIDKCD